jgi:hypothetical protein
MTFRQTLTSQRLVKSQKSVFQNFEPGLEFFFDILEKKGKKVLEFAETRK